MYYLYVRGKAYKHDGDHWILRGIFPGSPYWSDSLGLAVDQYGANNITYRFHSRKG